MKKLMVVLFGILVVASLFADTELGYDQDGTRMFGYACGG